MKGIVFGDKIYELNAMIHKDTGNSVNLDFHMHIENLRMNSMQGISLQDIFRLQVGLYNSSRERILADDQIEFAYNMMTGEEFWLEDAVVLSKEKDHIFLLKNPKISFYWEKPTCEDFEYGNFKDAEVIGKFSIKNKKCTFWPGDMFSLEDMQSVNPDLVKSFTGFDYADIPIVLTKSFALRLPDNTKVHPLIFRARDYILPAESFSYSGSRGCVPLGKSLPYRIYTK